MMKKLRGLVVIACILSMLSSGVGVFAAGYDVISETNIAYSCVESNYYDDTYDEYWQTRTYSNLISNFSSGYSVVYENCVAQTNDFVFYTTVSSSYVIDQNGNKIDTGNYDSIGIETVYNEDGTPNSAVLAGRDATFQSQIAEGVDMYGGVIVCKNGKCGYLGLNDGTNIPCEHTGAILRYDDNVFGVNPDYYLGQAEYFIDATGKKLLSDIDLSPVPYEHYTFTPSLKYLGNNVFYYAYESGESGKPSKAKYIDINGNEIPGYTPKINESRIYYEFDADALKNYYEYDGLRVASNDGYGAAFVPADEKVGIIDEQNNILVPFIYDDISGLQDGYCWASKDGKWYLIKISTDELDVQVNGKSVGFDQIPLIINGRTLAPLRAIFEALDATVEWDDNTKTIIATRGDTTVTMTIGKGEMYKNGNMIWLDEAPQIIGERTLVPVRAIAESFDCKVDWDGETQTVSITK